MVVKTVANDVQNKYTFRRKGGKSIIDRKPIFSPDGEFVLIIVENIVRVHSVQTGDCVRILEPEDSDSHLISLYFPENEAHNLYSCTESGQIIIWTWEKGVVLRDKLLNIKPNCIISTCDFIDNNECFITSIIGENIFCGTYSIKTGSLLIEYKRKLLPFCGSISVTIGWCEENRFVAISNGSPSVMVYNLSNPRNNSIILNYNKLRVLSVAAHSEHSCLVMTDTLGRATILRGNLYKPHSLAREVLHWHFLPLITATFTIQGSYLLTGGLESVLVKWSIGNLSNKANDRQFIPRLPGNIKYITTSPSYIVITLSNNTIVIANAQLRVVSTILECGGLSPAVRVLGSALMYHRGLGALLLGGRTGHLQLYSTSTDKVLYNIDITQLNNLPCSRLNLLPLNTEVTCAAISADGSSLVTSEYRNDGVIYTEEKLKFWTANKQGLSPFNLNTCVNLSHGGCNVISLALDNFGKFCVSAGGDRKFRIWKKEISKDAEKKKISWTCLTACYYSSGIGTSLSHNILNKFKSMDYQPVPNNCYPYMVEYMKPDIVEQLMNIRKENSLVKRSEVNSGVAKDEKYDMAGVAISQDGSLIAAWFGCKLTLWDSHSCSLRTTLSHVALRPTGEDVRFGNDDAAHYLVCTTKSCLAVWSLLSLSVKWIVQMKPSCLTADPFSNKMAVVTINNDVFIFTPHSSEPILNKTCLLDPKTGVFKYCTFGAASNKDIRLYMMRNDSEIYCLEPQKADRGRLEIISKKNTPKSNFSVLIAEQQLSDIQPPQANADDIDAIGGTNTVTHLFSGAPHMMPPVSNLCSTFLEQLSGKKELLEQDEEDDAKDQNNISDDSDTS